MADEVSEPDAALVRALREWIEAKKYLYRATAAEAEAKGASAQGFRAHANELHQLEKYLRSVEQTVRDPHESADPVRTLENWAERAEQRRRSARTAQAAEVDDRVERLGGPK